MPPRLDLFLSWRGIRFVGPVMAVVLVAHSTAAPQDVSSEIVTDASRLRIPNDVADLVLGQPDMATPFPNRTDGRGLVEPPAVAVDTSVEPYRLYVVDSGNNRVLGYRQAPEAFRPGTRTSWEQGEWPIEADLVLGQPDLNSAFRTGCTCTTCTHRIEPGTFLSPTAVTVDPQGNVYVADAGYHRILRFDQPFEKVRAGGDAVPAADDGALQPDQVYGQGECLHSAGANREGVSARSLSGPRGLFSDPRTGHLWVADTSNHRVLCFFSPLTSDRADLVFGQEDFASASPNAGGITAESLFAPTSIAMVGEDLVVADSGNHRLLLWREVLKRAKVGPEESSSPIVPPADMAIGQDGAFDRAERGCSPYRLNFPSAVAAVGGEAGRRIVVADSGNHRVLMFELGDLGAGPPMALWGQGRSLHTGQPNSGGLGPASLAGPAGLAIAPDGTLWVADLANHRVLGYSAVGAVTSSAGQAQPEGPEKSSFLADRVIGQRDLHRATPNYVDGLALHGPRDVAIDRSVTPNRLYVCDTNNHRILGYASTEDLGPDAQPAIVIGQPDVWTANPGAGAGGLLQPTSIAVDDSGGLFVADRENNRVLWFPNPFETAPAAGRTPHQPLAVRVFGQPDFNAHTPNTGGVSARSLNRPEGVAVDARGNLYVADTRNHRVLRFSPALEGNGAADAVWGQGGDFTRSAEYGGKGIAADTLSYPFGLSVHPNGLLAVADTNSHRVLLFDLRSGLPEKGAGRFSAVRAFGQGGALDRGRDNDNGCSARSLSGPENVLFHSSGLFVADTANCRILYYEDVRSTEEAAAYVYGQFGSFTSNLRHGGAIGPRTVWFPSGMDLDDHGNLYVADREQNRVLIFRRSGGSVSEIENGAGR